MESLLFLKVTLIVIGIVVLATFGGLTWVFERLGLSGVRDPMNVATDRPVARVKTPFITEPSTKHAKGVVEYRGELWSARCDITEVEALQKGAECAVIERHGLILHVRKHDEHAV